MIETNGFDVSADSQETDICFPVDNKLGLLPDFQKMWIEVDEVHTNQISNYQQNDQIQF